MPVPETGAVPTITGKDIALAASADFEDFYLLEAGMKVEIVFENVGFPAFRPNETGGVIVIPQDMADEIIDGPDKLHFHLLMIGHEIAHLVHEHGRAKDLLPDQDMALEYWADFYGAKVMMMLVTYGQCLKRLYRRYYPGPIEFERPMESIGRAIGRLVTTVYRDHPRYPKKLLRVGLICNGVCSVLRREMPTADLIWYFSVYKRLFESQPVKELILFNAEDIEEGPGPLQQVRRWHRETQGDRRAISDGLRSEFLPFLHTTFDHSDEELAENEAIRRAELRAYGYDV